MTSANKALQLLHVYEFAAKNPFLLLAYEDHPPGKTYLKLSVLVGLCTKARKHLKVAFTSLPLVSPPPLQTMISDVLLQHSVPPLLSELAGFSLIPPPRVHPVGIEELDRPVSNSFRKVFVPMLSAGFPSLPSGLFNLFRFSLRIVTTRNGRSRYLG